MNRILSKKNLQKELIRLEISTLLACTAIEAGQYIIVKTSTQEPAVALPVIKCDPGRMSVTVIYSPSLEGAGEMASLAVGSVLKAVEGPFGLPVEMPGSATVLCVGDDKGAATLLAVMASLAKSGNRIVALLKVTSQGQALLEEEISALAHEQVILFREGCEEQKGTLQQAVTQALRDHSIQGVVVAGSARTIRDTLTISIHHPLAIQALLVDSPSGKSVHGIYRVSSSMLRSVCVDGHDFNAYYASFDEMVRRFEHTTASPLTSQTASMSTNGC